MIIYRPVRRVLPSLFLLLAISLGCLFFHLGSLPLSGADEPRYARIAQEMNARGAWITPTLEGRPWLEKPPLYYWITKPFISIFSDREVAARLGPAICALMTAMAIFWLGLMLWSRLSGLYASLILLTSLGFAGFGRSASTDMPFTCCITLAMAILALAVERDIGLKVLGAYVFLGLAVLAKGPAAVILAAGIGLFVWFLDDRGLALRRWRIVPGLFLTATLSVPWFWLVFRQNGYAFISTFFINHNFARYITDIHHHSEPFFYYLPALLALFFPWSGWLPLLVSKSPREGLDHWRQWHPVMLLLACWVLFPLIFFSFSDSKLPGYILPSLPPLALILGVNLSRWTEGSVRPPRLRAAIYLHLIFSAAMAGAAPFYFQKEYGGNWNTGLILSVAIFVPALFASGFGLGGNCRRAFKATVLQGLILLLAIAQFAFPVLGAYHSTRDIAQLALKLRQTEEPIITYRFFHHTLYYYTGYQIFGEFDDLESLRHFTQKYPSSLIVTNIKGLREISGSGRFPIRLLGKQGDFRLLRISGRREQQNSQKAATNFCFRGQVVSLSGRSREWVECPRILRLPEGETDGKFDVRTVERAHLQFPEEPILMLQANQHVETASGVRTAITGLPEPVHNQGGTRSYVSRYLCLRNRDSKRKLEVGGNSRDITAYSNFEVRPECEVADKGIRYKVGAEMKLIGIGGHTCANSESCLCLCTT